MTRTPAIAAAGAALVLAAGAAASGRADVDRVWIDGTARSFTVAGPAHASTTTPLFVIAPIDAAHPLHSAADASNKGFGAHDHVMQLPSGVSTYRTNCALTLVVPGRRAKVGANVLVRQTLTPAGPKPLVYAVRLGRIVPLNRGSRVTEAAAAHLITTFKLGVTFGCTIAAAG